MMQVFRPELLLPLAPTPADLERLEAVGLEMPQRDVPVTRRHCAGVYIQEITLPAGSYALGNAHRHDCINNVLTGSVSVVIDGELKRITAPSTFIGKAGDRKIGYIHEDSTWQTLHATDETDPEKLDELLIIKSETLKAHERRLIADRQDYHAAVAELGYTHEEVVAISTNTADFLDVGCEQAFVARSQRHGQGLFAGRDFEPGEVIAVARTDGFRTNAGRYTNHSLRPNAAMVAIESGDVQLVAAARIPAGCEILVDYRQARRASSQSTKEIPCHPSH